LASQGRKLRDHLQRVLRGELLVPQQQQQQQQQQTVSDSSSSTSADGSTAGADSSNTSDPAAAVQQSGSVLDESAAHEWCCSAEALDLATPESFRHQVTSITMFTYLQYQLSTVPSISIYRKVAD
jgi:hypothetical protein